MTNSVPGTGTYRGPGTSASGSFSPATAGAGTHRIWFVFASNGGCTDSVYTDILVHPKPVSTFTVDANVCQGSDATISNASTIASGSITSWNWNFGNGITETHTTGAAFPYSYAATGSYTVKLVTQSNEGCTSDTASRVIGIRPLPNADFTLPTAVCMPNGLAQFTNNSSVADNSSLSYAWQFGDGQTSSTQSPSHTYTSGGPVNVALTATSSYGCVQTVSKPLTAFYDKPIAQFAVTPDTLCQGSNNVFTDESTAPNSTVQSWSWSFGDGSTASNASPVKRYNTPGNFPVMLTVRNAQGCTSDPYRDTVIVYLQPVISAGPSFVVPQGTTVRFNPTANDSSSLVFQWTPAAGMSNSNGLRPTIIANATQVYTLTATGSGGCTASDTLTVKILKPVTVPNSFSPNGDGINDNWMITNLADYPGCKVEVFNRYGQPVYRSTGYGTPWNGTYKGGPVPFGTYYYVITLNSGFAPVTGSVTIVR